MRRGVLVLGAVLASVAVACDSEDRGLTQPTPPAGPPAIVFVHNTLNPPDDRSSVDLWSSYRYDFPSPMFASLAPWTWDDFTSAEATAIRTVSWQGGSCRGRDPASSGRPRASPNSFNFWFYADDNGRPSWIGNELYRVTLTRVEVQEFVAFDAVRNDADCAYYDYTAVLPMPFPVTAGSRYWLLIRADMGNTGIGWGWRAGRRGNGVAAGGSQRAVFTLATDMAFSLSGR